MKSSNPDRLRFITFWPPCPGFRGSLRLWLICFSAGILLSAVWSSPAAADDFVSGGVVTDGVQTTFDTRKAQEALEPLALPVVKRCMSEASDEYRLDVKARIVLTIEAGRVVDVSGEYDLMSADYRGLRCLKEAAATWDFAPALSDDGTLAFTATMTRWGAEPLFESGAVGVSSTSSGGGGAIQPIPVPTWPGTLDEDALAKVLDPERRTIQQCYGRHLAFHPDAAGTVEVEIYLQADGSVERVRTARNSVGKPVGECVERVLSGLSFPAPDGGAAKVKKQYVFSTP